MLQYLDGVEPATARQRVTVDPIGETGSVTCDALRRRIAPANPSLLRRPAGAMSMASLRPMLSA